MNAYQVVVNISVNASGAAAGVAPFNNAMGQVKAIAAKTAQESALSFNNIFGANFFADLAAGIVRSMASGFAGIVRDALKAATDAQAAFKGLGSVATNLGIDEKAAVESLKNLDLVKNGLLNLQDGALALKNLLATGFGIKESIDILKTFGDSAAFGRQAALSFGYAISSATQGIKNQNSILVDNAGITKNISVILREYGFEIQDLSDKTKGLAARQALYQGLLKEGALFQGNANVLLETAQGRVLQLDAAWQRLLISLGKVITESNATSAVLGGLVKVLDVLGKYPSIIVGVASAVGILTVALIAMNSAQLAALPVIGNLIQSIVLLGKVMTATAGLTAGATATAALATAGWAAVALALAGVVYAITQYVSASRELTAIDDTTLKGLAERQKATVQETDFLNTLSGGVARNADEQKKLGDIYGRLDPLGRARVQLIDEEADKTAELVRQKQALARATDFAIETEGLRRATEFTAALKEAVNIRNEQILMEDRYRNSLNYTSAQSAKYGTQEQEASDIREHAIARTSQLNDELGKNQKRLNDAATSLDNYGDITGKSAEEVLKSTGTFNTHGLTLDYVTGQYKEVTAAQNDTAKATKDLTTTLEEQLKTYEQLSDLLSRSPARQKILKDFANETAEALTILGEKSKKDVEAFTKARIAADPRLKQVLDTEKAYQQVLKSIEGVTDTSVKKTKEQKSEYDRLKDSVKKLNDEVKSFTDLTSREFKLRFEREELERLRRDFEEILTLRREVGEPLDAALPTDPEGISNEIRRLERLADIKDAVQKATDAQADAERDLAIAIQTKAIPVVDAATRALLGYEKATRDLKDSDAQLTADVITASRLRQDRIQNETQNTFRAYQNLRLDLLRETEQINADLEKNKLLLRVLEGDEAGIQAEINDIINVTMPKTDMQTISDNTTKIAADVAKIAGTPPPAGSTGGSVSPTAAVSQVGPASPPGMIYDAITGRMIPDRAGVGDTSGGKRRFTHLPNTYMSNLPVATFNDQQLPSAAQPVSPDDQVVSVQTNAAGAQAEALLREKFANIAKDARIRASIEAKTRILANEETLKAGLIKLEDDINAARSDQKTARLRETRANAVEIKLLEEDIAKAAAQDAEYVARIQQQAKRDRLREAKALSDQLIQLEEDFAHAGELSAKRIEVAYKAARNEFYRVDELIGRTRATLEYMRALQAKDPRALDAERARQDDTAANNSLRREQDIQALRRNLFSQTPEDVATRASEEIQRYELAWLEALENIRQADIEARESMIESQVKIADATVYHADRANAKVLEFIASQKSVTDAIADAKIGVIQASYNFIDKGLDRILGKLGDIGDVLKNLIGSLIKASLNKVFLRLFGLENQGVVGGAGGGSPGSSPAGLGNLLGLLNQGSNTPVTSGLGTPGSYTTPPFVPRGNFAAGGAAGGISPSVIQRFFTDQGVLTPTSVSGTQPTFPGINFPGAGTSTGAGASGRTSIGQRIFGQQGFGFNSGTISSLGAFAGIAGGLIGGPVGGVLTGAATGIGAASALATILGISSIGGPVGLAIGAAIGAVFGIGQWLFGRNKLRRQEEKQRSAILIDSKSKLNQLLDALRGGRIDSASALAQAEQIRQDYLNQVGQLKDRKTRTHAIQTVRELDAIITLIRGAGVESDAAAERFKLLVPTFATGGNINFVSRAGGGSREHLYIAKRHDEAVLTQQDVANLGGAGVMARAGVRGYAGMASAVPSTSSAARSVSYSDARNSGGVMNEPQQLFVLVADEKAADRIVEKSRPNTVARKMFIHTQQTGLEGYAGRLLQEFNR